MGATLGFGEYPTLRKNYSTPPYFYKALSMYTIFHLYPCGFKLIRGEKPPYQKNKLYYLKKQISFGSNKSELAKEFSISRETLYKYLRISV